MGLFARALRPRKGFDQGVGTLAAGAHILQIPIGRSRTGISITADAALSYSAFWAAVRILAESLAVLPVSVVRREGENRVTATDHPVHRIVHWMANPWTTAYRWRETAMVHRLVWGNSYSLKIRDGRGDVAAVVLLDPQRMTVEGAPPEHVYRYTLASGETRTWRATDIVHLRGIGGDELSGWSILRYARETIGLGLATEEHGSRYFGQGAIVPFVLSTPDRLSAEAVERLREQIKNERSGLGAAWEPWILEEGLTPKELSMPHEDAQWLQTRRFQVDEIARWFRLPPHMLADLERATYTNIETQGLEFVKYSLLPWITRDEQDLGLQLLGTDWEGAGGAHYLKTNVAALERADIKTRYEAYATGIQNGFLSGDDIAALEDWERWPGGSQRFRQANLVPLES
jgi:HK97 family phage portal protein